VRESGGLANWQWTVGDRRRMRLLAPDVLRCACCPGGRERGLEVTVGGTLLADILAPMGQKPFKTTLSIFRG